MSQTKIIMIFKIYAFRLFRGRISQGTQLSRQKQLCIRCTFQIAHIYQKNMNLIGTFIRNRIESQTVFYGLLARAFINSNLQKSTCTSNNCQELFCHIVLALPQTMQESSSQGLKNKRETISGSYFMALGKQSFSDHSRYFII